MPPVSNYPLYLYRLFAKGLSFFLFGLGTLLLVITILPLMTVFLHPRDRFKKTARRFISSSFRGFTALMGAIGAAKLDVDDRVAYRRLSSKIIVANHPSLLDVVILISLIPNADCIVNSGLMHNIIVRGVIRRLYILNSLEFDELAEACIQSLNQGYCIIIFPEGTRTRRTGEMKLKKGAARLSLLSGRDILPVHIGGTDKWGLGKHDPWTAYNHREMYVYRIRMQDAISPDNYAGLESYHAIKHLNEDIRTALQDERMQNE
jgi:1-acyl-sn-glycerol-3-phosphate acyltransferase